MSGLSSFLFNGQPPPSVTSTQGSSTQLPQWYTNYFQNILGQAQAVANQPFPAYTGELVAPASQLQNAAYGAANSMNLPQLGQAQYAYGNGLVGQGQSTINGALSQLTNPGAISSGINSYMSPYLSDVTNQIATLGARNLTQNLLPSVNSTFIGSGQFGSGAHGYFTQQALQNENESVLNQQAQALESGYQNAASNFLTGVNQQVGAGQALGQLGNTEGALGQLINSSGINGISALSQLGAEQQGTQQNLDTALYNQFQNQVGYPRLNTAYLESALTGGQVPTTTTSVAASPGSNYQPSGLSQLSGLASGIGALSKLFG